MSLIGTWKIHYNYFSLTIIVVTTIIIVINIISIVISVSLGTHHGHDLFLLCKSFSSKSLSIEVNQQTLSNKWTVL